MKHAHYPILFFLILLAISSCNNKADIIDQTIPSIIEGKISPTPTTGFICGTQSANVINANSGDEIILPLYLRDDEALSHYTITIQENFNCQSHKNDVNNWELDKKVNLSGTSADIQEVLSVPTNVTAGSYICTINLWDAAGNQASTLSYYLQLLNNADLEVPMLTRTLPTTNIVSLNNGDILQIQGRFSDNSSLRRGNLKLSYTDLDGKYIKVLEKYLDHTNNNMYDYELEYTIPENLASGSYNFELYGYDMVGNKSNKQVVTVVIL